MTARCSICRLSERGLLAVVCVKWVPGLFVAKSIRGVEAVSIHASVVCWLWPILTDRIYVVEEQSRMASIPGELGCLRAVSSTCIRFP